MEGAAGGGTEQILKADQMARITAISPIEKSGLAPSLSDSIFDEIAQFAGYGFNKSHAAAYAVIAYKTAWLRTHHPEAYFAAAMNLDLTDVEALATFASELRIRKIPLWHPCVNRSQALFTPVARRARPVGPTNSGRTSGRKPAAAQPIAGAGFAISYGLAALRGLGRTAAEAIVAERSRAGAFGSVDDFVRRMGAVINKRALQALAQAGAFDRISRNRAEALRDIEGGARKAADRNAGQMSMFDMLGAAEDAPALPPLERLEMLALEFSTLGHYITGHPLDDLYERRRDEGHFYSSYVLRRSDTPPRSAAMPAIVTKVDIRRTKSGDTMAVLTLSDPDGVYEALAFGDIWSLIHDVVKPKASLVFEMTVSTRGDERRLLVDSAKALSLEAGARDAA